MNDKPGAGKTYAILGLIHYTDKRCNIIVVPQNIILQWCESIHNFSDGLIKYKRMTEYSDMLDLYNVSNDLFKYDILLTTPLYYNMIATTMKSNFLNVGRVFFDEIDSICSFVVNEINANFIWFVSASFDYEELGVYTKKIDINLLHCIYIKCYDSFIDNMFILDEPNVYKIICKNIYLDNIFDGLFTVDELKILNAMDYSRLKRKFCNKIARNEVEAIDILVRDKIDIIETEKLRIIDINKAIANNPYSGNLVVLEKQLSKSNKSLEDSEYKLNLIKERLKDNNCCPLCYVEFSSDQKKVISPCCKNLLCFDCADNWYTNMKKNSCIYCNLENTKFEDFIIVKPEIDNICSLCFRPFENICYDCGLFYDVPEYEVHDIYNYNKKPP